MFYKKRLFLPLILIIFLISLFFISATCYFDPIDFLIELAEDIPSNVSNCVEGSCELTIPIKSNRPVSKFIQGMDDLNYEQTGENTYSITVSLMEGINMMEIKGLYGSVYSNPINLVVICHCPDENSPEIEWNPDKPPTDTTSKDTAKLNLKSDKILDRLSIWNNTQPNVIESPVYEENETPGGKEYLYQEETELEEGNNKILVQGEADGSKSNVLEQDIEKTTPPTVEFEETPPTQLSNCIDNFCDVTLTFRSDQPLQKIIAYVIPELGDNFDSEHDDPEGTESEGDYLYSITFQIPSGENDIQIVASNGNGQDILTCTIECVCPEEDPPTIEWNPEKSPTDTTADATAVLNIVADQILKQIRILNNSIENIIESPVYEEHDTPDGKEYHYDEDVELEDGENDIQVQGENDNGESNTIDHVIEKMTPPTVEFAEQPPVQVDNCVDNECEVTLHIKSNKPLNRITGEVIPEGGQPIPNEFIDPESTEVDGFYHYSITIKLINGENYITIQGNSNSNFLNCTIECICPEDGGYTLKDTIGEQTITQPIDINVDYYSEDWGVLVLSKFIDNMEEYGQIYKLNTDISEAARYYAESEGYQGAKGVACGTSDDNSLFLLEGVFIAQTNSDGAPVGTYPIYGETHQTQTGQIDRYGDQINYISRDTNESGYDFIVSLFPDDSSQKGNITDANAGCDTINDSAGSHPEETLMTRFMAGSSQRDTTREVICMGEGGSSDKLFDIPIEDGIPMDINVINDATDFYCLVTTQRDDGYWVNIYSNSGEKLHDFKTHELVTTGERTTGDDPVIYSAIEGEFDDYIYVINSHYPGVQVWELSE